jgi:Cu-Zn family superoxide dismutase
MRKTLPLIALAGVAVIGAWRIPGPQDTGLEIEIFNGQRKTIGTATLNEGAEGGVDISLDLRDLKPGEHGIHIHETGRCDPPTFESAGGHFNPSGRQHGSKNPRGAHSGDMPNLEVGEDGKAVTSLTAPQATLESGEATSLLDQDGAALVIHAAPDDLMTDPSGESGDRIACGVIDGNG